MRRNSDGAGFIFIMLLAGTILSKSPDTRGRPGSRPVISPPDPAGLAREFHRLVHVMEKVDSLGRFAANPPQLPEPSRLLNSAALPDMTALMNLLGPLLSTSDSEKI